MMGGVSVEKKRRKSGEMKRGWGYFRWGSKSAMGCGGETYLMAGNPHGYWVSRITRNSQLCN